MTLVLTELSEFGIAMAADTAVTWYSENSQKERYWFGARKLQPVPYINAGVSCWGQGHLQAANADTDEWLEGFINRHEADTTNLSDFVQALEAELRQIVPKIRGTGTLGFHVAAFVEIEAGPTPTFYHVHNGPSQYTNINKSIDPGLVNANHDTPPDVFQTLLTSGKYPITRNGDYRPYAAFWGFLEDFRKAIYQASGINIPAENSLSARTNYLRFQIKTMAEIYRLMGRPSIGGEITTLTISSRGIENHETRW